MNKYSVGVARADIPNANGRVYPREVIEKFVEMFNGPMFGHMIGDENTEKHSYVIEKLHTDGGVLIADICTADNSKGLLLSDMIEKDAISFSAGCIGKAKAVDGVVHIEDATLISINACRKYGASISDEQNNS